MPYSRQKDHAKFRREQQCMSWDAILKVIARRRRAHGVGQQNQALLFAAKQYAENAFDNAINIARSNRISITEFAFNFNSLSNYECLINFRFCKDDICNVAKALNWPSNVTRTSRNGYGTNPLLATCIVLRRFAGPCRWIDLEEQFGKHSSQLSEIFWESLERFIETRGDLMTGEICSEFVAERAQLYSEAVHQKSNAMSNCIGFIDGTVIGISRPGGYRMQNVVYNGHKRKHALKYQAVVTPDGLILHAFGPLEGRRHDWTLYIRSGIEEQLPSALLVDGKQYCIYGDSGYNRRIFLEVPFQGSSLSSAQKAFNAGMSSVRVTVEWMFKEIKIYWSSVDFKRKLRVRQSPVGLLYLSAMLLTNIRNCCYPNTISQYFGVKPPTLEDYLSHKDPST